MTKIPLFLVSTAGKTSNQIITEAGAQMRGELDLMEESTKYTVYVDDNFHHMDESYRYELEQYDTWSDAVKVCKMIVDENIKSYIQEGIDVADLYRHYTSVGDDPWVTPVPEGLQYFSAWSYAKALTDKLI